MMATPLLVFDVDDDSVDGDDAQSYCSPIFAFSPRRVSAEGVPEVAVSTPVVCASCTQSSQD